MQNKKQLYADMYNKTAIDVTSNATNWTNFLTTVGKVYKYPYHEQLMIHAQRPDATACAEYKLWNDKMNRYVRRGTAGIALIDPQAENLPIKYVFDISDTVGKENAKTPFTWSITEDNQKEVLTMFSKEFGINGKNLFDCVQRVAIYSSTMYDNINVNELTDRLDGTITTLNEKDIMLSLYEVTTNSISYTLCKRLGLDLSTYKDEVFSRVSNFDTVKSSNFLSSEVSKITNVMFKEIAKTIYKAERSKQHETNIFPRGRLHDTRPSGGGEHNTDREIRFNEESVSTGERPVRVRLSSEYRETTPSPSGDRPNSEQEKRATDERVASTKSTTEQREIPTSVGSTYADARRTSRGDNSSRADIQLNQSYSFFPTQEQQIKSIADRQSVNTQRQSAFSVSLEEIQKAIKGGTGYVDGKLRVYDFYKKNLSAKEVTQNIKSEYGHGGTSYTYLDGVKGFLNYEPSKGFVFSKDDITGNFKVSWLEVEKHTRLLIATDKYLSADEKAQYENNLVKNDVVVEEPTAPEIMFFKSFKDIETTIDYNNYSDGDTIGYNIDGVKYDVSKSGSMVFTTQTTSITPYGEVLGSNMSSEVHEKFISWKKSLEVVNVEVKETSENFKITDMNLGNVSKSEKIVHNLDAIRTLKLIEKENRVATKDEQFTLSRYVGWGGIPEIFEENNTNYLLLKLTLGADEYANARASVLNAHFTSPTIIKAIYQTIENLGFTTGNILEPSCGVGNFFGMLPKSMEKSNLYGVELDSITGRIAQKLYPNANITINGFEKTDYPDSFFDIAIGNVPFGDYSLTEKRYDNNKFKVHDHFFAKSLDKVRPNGVVAFVTSKGTLDKKNSSVRKYLAQRSELLGAIRLPNNAFKGNAGTEVTSDIIFLQKRERPLDIQPDWVHLGLDENDIPINSYFVENPHMILGKMQMVSGRFGMEATCSSLEGKDLAEQLQNAIKNIIGNIPEVEFTEQSAVENTSILADPNVKNYSYTLVDNEIYYRENSVMKKVERNATSKERTKGMIAIRECVDKLIHLQLEDYSDSDILAEQLKLNSLYDTFTAKYGVINSRGNATAFDSDSSYYLLCSLENIDEDGKLKSKADIFTKRTIRSAVKVTSVDTPSEALAVSLSEKACIDIEFMSKLANMSEKEIVDGLKGVIFLNPHDDETKYITADEYLSGNVREKLQLAKKYAELDPTKYSINVEALKKAQPKDLDASEIEVRLGATWIDKSYIQQFMYETFETPYRCKYNISVKFAKFTGEWSITHKNDAGYNDVASTSTYGTERANAYRILEDSLNLRDIRIYDTVTDDDGKEKRVLNKNQTTLASQKQQIIKDKFKEWIWNDPKRRQTLVKVYNENFNSVRPREYDGSHLTFGGINPFIKLREHQVNAIAHILYGNNVLLAHEVGAGKSFEMIAGAMESKRLGLCTKPLMAVPNHLTEQMASEFLRLYPAANILVATRKDFETKNRKKFCARIATGDYDAVIMGHSQFERIPISLQRQERLLDEQIAEITDGIAEVKSSGGERFTIKQLERTKKGLLQRLEKLRALERKDDVVTFEQLGVDKLIVDEAHAYKNGFVFTKMRNVAGLGTSESQKSSDMYMKCRYLDEITGGKGLVFATGTPVSNSITEIYVMQRYLQYNSLKETGLLHFDAWASTFGEISTQLEINPEGSGYRVRNRFNKFFNLPELMNMFKEVADIKTSDQLNLPTPQIVYKTVNTKPTDLQSEIVKELSDRATEVHANRVDPTVDNMLAITNDGRKLGLDQRVYNPMLPDDPNSKVNACVNNIYKIWEDTKADKLTQLVFCDLSTPKATAKTNKGNNLGVNGADINALENNVNIDEEATLQPFSVYNDIKEKLINLGIPTKEIAFIHDAKTEVQKKELFAKVRNGDVRLLIGSTSKCGAGMNVQDKLIALHDLDAPWRPGDLRQRSGRIERQGNMNETAYIYRYVTESTFDAYSWQTLENKQKFISQIMTSKSPVRSCDDLDESALSYAEIKALCAGNPKIKLKMDLDIEVSKLKLLKASHQSTKHKLEDKLLKYYPEQISLHENLITGFNKDIVTLSNNTAPKDEFMPMTIKGKAFTEKEYAGKELLSCVKDIKGLESIKIGEYRGFTMHLFYNTFDNEHMLFLKGAIKHNVTLGQDARGNLIRIDNVLDNMSSRLKTVTTQLDNLRLQQKNAEIEKDKPFPQEEELKVKSEKLAKLDVELNMGTDETEENNVIMKIDEDTLQKIRENNIDVEVRRNPQTDELLIKCNAEDKAEIENLSNHNNNMTL